MEISVCIITKNESEKLKRCLKSLKKYPVEIVVVDTGSTDRTQEVIADYADVGGIFHWCNDFSAARNYSISLAHHDVILVLDSDEWIDRMDLIQLSKAFEKNPELAGRIECVNHYDTVNGKENGHERICRIFDRRFYEYRGRIHEQVVRRDKTDGLYEKVPVRIGHSGYEGTPEEKKKKAARNIELLLLDLKEYGDDPYTLYQLGKSYFMQQEYEKAAEYFEKGLGFDLDPALEYVQDMVETYAYTLLSLKRCDEMMFLEQIYKEFAVSADYVFLMGLAYMNNERFDEAIREFEKAATYPHCKVEGCNSYKAYYNAGVICECLGRNSRAQEFYEKCGSYAPAAEGIKRLQMLPETN
jgi:hypothetical protein